MSRKRKRSGLSLESLEARIVLSGSTAAAEIVDREAILASVTTTNSDVAIHTPNVEYNNDEISPQTNQSLDVINIPSLLQDSRFAGIDGSGFTTVVLDTGIDLNHPFFGPDANQDGIADRIVYQYDFADNDNDASDQNNHGSNVASIIGSQDSVYGGVAPGVDIVALKVFTDSGSGNFGYVESALQWIIAHAHTDPNTDPPEGMYRFASVNMSLGDTENYQSPQLKYGIGDELAALAALDIIVVSSSGNDFFEFSSEVGVAYPAADPNSLSIGAVYDGSFGNFNYGGGASGISGEDVVTPFSQRHETLTTVFAPGAPITGANKSGGTVTMHGTSQAAPHVAGLAALAQQLAMQELGRTLTVAEFTTLIQETGTLIIDGDDEVDNVDNTGLSFRRIDAFGMAEGIVALSVGDPGSISGTLWNDVDGDGVFDTGEEALSNRTVYLDENNNGTLDTGERYTITDSNGDYSFNLLTPGTYTVAQVLPEEWEQTYPNSNGQPLTLLSQWDGEVISGGGSINPQHDDGGKGAGGVNEYADVWVDGDYAYLGHYSTDGKVEILDISDPYNPVKVAEWLVADGYRFQDVKVYDGVGYFGSDSGGGTFIVDLSDPTNPITVAHIGQTANNTFGVPSIGGGHNYIHNLSMWEGYLYTSSSRDNLVNVFDISDPANPVKIRTITAQWTVHDITAIDGRLYTSNIGGGSTDIFDISNVTVSAPKLANYSSGPLTHSNWPTADGNYVVTARETFDGDIRIHDVSSYFDSNPGNNQAVLVGQFNAADLGISAYTPHNPIIKGDRLYVSWYQAGIQVFDISDPANTTYLGGYDTFSGGVSGYNGNWGVAVDPDPESNLVFASDMENGLFIFASNPTSVHTVVLAEGEDETGIDFGSKEDAPPPPPAFDLVEIIDDEDPGYASTSGFVNTGFGGAYQSDIDYTSVGNGSQQASWTFTDLPIGTYSVAANWLGYSSRPSNAPYSVYDGTTLLGTVAKNQQVSSDDFTDAGVSWETMGEFEVSSGTLRVVLTNAGNTGYVVADAVRIELVSSPVVPEIDVFDGVSELFDGGTLNFGSPLEGGTSSKTITVKNTGTDTLTLTQITQSDLPSGFTLVSGLGSTSLAANQSTTFTIQLNTAAAGNFSGTLSIANSDPDEDPFDINLVGSVVAPVPEIVVQEGSSNVADGASVSFGTVNVGASVSKIFTVQNSGTAALQLTQISQSDLPTGFTLVSGFESTTLEIGESTTFEIALNTTTGGSFSGTFSFLNNDSDESPFDIQLSGTVNAPNPEIAILDGGANIADGGSLQFGTVLVGGQAAKILTLQNTGDASLSLTQIVQSDLPTGFTLVSGFGSTTVAAGGSTTFTIALDTSIAGNFSGTLSIQNNDADESPFDISLSGIVKTPAPEIVVLDGGANIVDGGSLNFGTALVGGSASKTITIQNTGDGPLTLSQITQANLPTGFTLVSGLGSTTLAAGASTTFQIAVNTSQSGSFSGTLSISNNDADESPFDIALSATVIVPNPEIAISVGGVNLNDGGSLNFGSVAVGSSASKVITIQNTGTGPLILTQLTQADLPSGFTLVSGLTSTTVAAGATTQFTIALNTSSQGTFGGQFSLLSNDADEASFEISVSGSVTAAATQYLKIIDDEDAGYSSTSGFGNIGFSGAYNGDVDYTPVGNGSQTATWNFTNLQPGTYRVSATWRGYASRPNNAPYAIYDGTQLIGSVQKNQQQNPNDLTANGFTWEDLGNFTVAGNSLKVVLNNNASNGYVIADAIRVELVVTPQPEIAVSQGSTGVVDGGTIDFGNVTVGGTATKSFTIQNTGNAALTLTQISQASLPTGYTLVSGLTDLNLTTGESTTFQIALDTSIAGSFEGVLSILNNDADEGPFEIILTGSVGNLQPEIAVNIGGNPIADGGTIDFGDVFEGDTVSKVVTVQNTGNGVLNLTQITQADLPTGFTLVSGFATTTVAAGASTSFEIELDTSTAGNFSGTLSFGNNDSDENPYDLNLLGDVAALTPEIVVSISGSEVIDGGTIDFGEVFEGDTVSKTITVQNTGNGTLNLTQITQGDLPTGFTLVSGFASTTIAAGASTSFEIELDTSTPGNFSGTLSFGNNDSDENPYDLNLLGDVAALTPEIVVSISGSEVVDGGTIDFGDVFEGDSVSKVVNVLNTGNGTLNLTQITQADLPTGFTLVSGFATTTVAAGASTSFEIELNTTAAGNFSGTLSFANNDSDENSYDLNLLGDVAALTPEIVVSLSGSEILDGGTIDFGDVFEGDTVSETITVQNTGNGTLNLTQITQADLPTGFTLVSGFATTTVAAGASTSFEIELDTSTAGNFSGTLSFGNNDSDENPYDLNLLGDVAALTPEIVVSISGSEVVDGGTIDFGDVFEGDSVNKTITVENTGDGTLNLTQITQANLPTGFTLVSGFATTTVAAGASTSFEIELNTSTPGNFSGTLSFVNNDSDENPYDLNLLGDVAALTPEIVVTLSGIEVVDGGTVDFGDVFEDDTVSKTITVQNTGNGTLNLTQITQADLPTGFTLVSGFATTVAAGASTSFEIELNTSTAGSFSGTLSIGNNDADEDPYDLNLLGGVAALTPEIVVSISGSEVVDGGTIDFGDVFEGDTVSKTITVQNTGNGTLNLTQITQANLPTGFTLVSGFSSTSVAAGASTTFEIELNTSSAGNFSGTLSFANNDADEDPYDLNLLGDVAALTPEIVVFISGSEVVDGGTIDFGDVLEGDSVSKTITVQNTGNGTLNLTQITQADLPIGFTLVSGFATTTVAAGGSTSFQIALNTSTAGNFSGTLSFVNNDSDENPYDLNLLGDVEALTPEIVVSISGSEVIDGGTIDFGDVFEGDTVSETITVQNTGNGTLNLTQITQADLPTGFTLVNGFATTTVAAGASTSFEIELNTSAAGNFSGTLSFNNNDADEDPYDLNLLGDVTALAPEIVVSISGGEVVDGGTIDFGDVFEGDSVSKTITVQNTGNGTLNLTQITQADLPTGFTLVGGFAATTVASGASTSFQIALNTSTAGNFSGTLSFANNDSDEDPYDLNLLGDVAALTPEILVSSSGSEVVDGGTIDFGDVFEGDSVSKTITIQNIGNGTLNLTQITQADLPAGFTLVSGFATTTVAAGASTSFEIELNTSTADNFSGTLSFGNNDADENPYDLNLLGDVAALTPEIVVSISGSEVVDGGTIDFGDVFEGDTVSKTITVQNTGDGTLTLTQITQANLPTGFTLVSGFATTTVAAGASTSFEIELNTSTPGNFSGTLSFVNNDSDENPYDLNLLGDVAALTPEIVVSISGSEVVDGGTIDFGNVFEGDTVSKTITVQNTGNGTLNLTQITQANLPTGFTLVSGFATTTVAAGASTSFEIELNTSTAGNFSGTLSFSNNDSDENPYDLNLLGDVAALTPEIVVSISGSEVVDGGTIDFGDVFDGDTVSKTITVQNTGNGTLNLTQITQGDLPTGFTLVSGFASTTVAAGGSTSFEIELNTSTAGNFSGTLSFVNNDADENPYDLNLLGDVTALTPEIVVSISGSEVVDGGTIDFGDVFEGDTVSKTITVQNTGNGTLNLTQITQADLPTGFTLVSGFATTTVAAGGSTSFEIELNTSTAGNFSGTLSIVNNDANENPYDLELSGQVHALVPELIRIIDNGDAGFTTSGFFNTGYSLAYAGDMHYTTVGNGSNTATWTFTDLVPGTYNVASIWVGFTSRPTNVPFSIYDGNTLVATVPKNQQINPNDFTDQGTTWESIGDFEITGTTLKVVVSNNANSGYVIADAVRIELLQPALPAPEIAVANGSTNINDGGTLGFGSAVVGSSATKVITVTNTGTATLNLTQLTQANLPTGFTLVSGFQSTSLAAGAFTTFTVALNTSTAGTFGGTLSFLNNDADESPFDIVLSGSVTTPAPEIAVSSAGTNINDGGTLNFGSVVQGGAASKVITIQNNGTANLQLTQLTQANLPSGYTLVSALGGTNLAPGASTTFTIALNTGAVGSFGGTLDILNNDSDENPFNINLSGTVTAPVTEYIAIMDDRDAGYSATSGFANIGFSGAYNSDVDYTPVGNGSQTASWTFSNLPAGTYRVSATWRGYASRPSNAPYKIYDGTTLVGSVAKNQQQNPDDLNASGFTWEDLGYFVVSGGTLKVVLSNNASNGYVIADAIRIELMQPASGGSIGLVDGGSSQGFSGGSTTLIEDSSESWTTVPNSTTRPERTTTVAVQSLGIRSTDISIQSPQPVSTEDEDVAAALESSLSSVEALRLRRLGG